MSEIVRNKKLSNRIKEIVDNSRNQLRPFKATGELNKYYINGKQNYKINPNTFTIQQKRYQPNIYKEKKTFNKMLPIYLARQGILSDNRPIPGFKPDHNYPASVKAAVKGNNFIKDFSKEANVEKMYNQIIRAADIYGLVWIKTGIDWSDGDETYKVEMETTYKGETQKVEKTIYEGRPFIDVCSIYEVFPTTLRADNMKEVPALVHRRPLTVRHIEDRYNIKGLVKEEPVQLSKEVHLTNPNYMNSEDKYAYLYEYYEAPTAQYPDGRFIVMVNDLIITSKKLPYKNGPKGTRTIPFDFYNLQGIQGVIPGITSYAQVIDAQDTYNSIKNRLLEYINHTAIGQVYEFQGSLVNPKKWTNTPGERIKLKPHAKIPEPVRKDKIGNELVSYAKSIEEDMLSSAGLSQLTAFGTPRSNVRSEDVADKTEETDSNKLAVALQNVSDTLVEVFKKILYLEKERQYILSEELGLTKRDDFAIKYMLDDVDPQELVIVNREYLMKSDIVIEKKLNQAHNMGLYNPELGLSYRAKIEMLEALNSNYLADTLDPLERANYARIKREHAKAYNNEEIEVLAEELHEMHVEEHTLELLSSEMADLEVEDPEKFKTIKQRLQKHIGEHKQYIDSTAKQGDYDRAKAMN